MLVLETNEKRTLRMDIKRPDLDKKADNYLGPKSSLGKPRDTNVSGEENNKNRGSHKRYMREHVNDVNDNNYCYCCITHYYYGRNGCSNTRSPSPLRILLRLVGEHVRNTHDLWPSHYIMFRYAYLLRVPKPRYVV